MANTELREEWERRIAVFRSSGQTQVEWCKINNLNLHQLKYWLKKIERPDSNHDTNPNWIPVNLEDSSIENNAGLVVRIGAASIEVKPGFNAAILADVVKTLKSIC